MASPHATTRVPDVAAAQALLERPLLELVFEAARVHREHHDPRRVQCAQLLSIKTGGCSEDCGYCSQSAHHGSDLASMPLLPVEQVVDEASRAKAGGADRFCMGAAWGDAREGEPFERVIEMVRRVKGLGLETCATLGMLTGEQARRLKDAGLDYYNHNLDTGRGHYDQVVSTRDYDARLDTLDVAREAGLSLCCGGILGLGEDTTGRAELLAELAAMDPPPQSVPINNLVPVEGTPMADHPPVDWSELVRVIAAARILMPRSVLRLSAGREALSEEAQALCFLAGVGSIFVGEELLTTPNPERAADAALLNKLGLCPLAD
jgi:biotin synthase